LLEALNVIDNILAVERLHHLYFGDDKILSLLLIDVDYFDGDQLGGELVPGLVDLGACAHAQPIY